MYILGFVNRSEQLRHFASLISEPVDQQILYMCMRNNPDTDLDTVLRQWKYSLQYNQIDEQKVFRDFLSRIYPVDLIKTMEETLSYEG